MEHLQHVDVAALLKWAQANWDTVAAILAVGGGFGWMAWRLFLAYGIDPIVDAFARSLELGMAGKDPRTGHEIADPIYRRWFSRIAAATVEMVEEKLPDAGMGEAKMRLALDEIYAGAARIPVVGSRVAARLRTHEPKLREFIEVFVSKMNERLKKVQAQEPPPPAAPEA